MTSPVALHSKGTPSWGTPTHIIEKARELLGGIDVDPGTSAAFNTLVQATQIYTEETNGLIHEWNGKVFVNPPGGLVVEFWEKLMAEVIAGRTTAAFWVGFSVEQLCVLADKDLHPLSFSTCILRKRLKFNTSTLTSGGSPSHGNYITGVGVIRDRFDALFKPFGICVHGDLAL